ncbi:hypothetical protein H0H93_000822 [Arthromyces matolae]|nr:hypothetical protein H0H93_000822 [Arthromyces matolae]
MRSRDYDFKTPGGHTVTINVCRRPAKESFGLKDVDDSKVAGFVRRDHGDFSIGEVNTTLSMQGSNLRLTLTGGSKCNLRDTNRNTDLRASTLVDFVCDTSVFGTGEPTLVAQFPQGSDDDGVCGYVLEWRTHIACPTNEPGGVWGFFGFLIFTIIGIALLYLVAGTLYNRFVLRLSGWDQIPKFSIESMKYHASEAIDWVKDLTGIGHGRYHYPIPGHDGEREQEEGLLGGGGRSANSNLNTPFSGGSTAFPRSAQGTGRLNPVSHHAQVSSPPSGAAAPSDSVDDAVEDAISCITTEKLILISCSPLLSFLEHEHAALVGSNLLDNYAKESTEGLRL